MDQPLMLIASLALVCIVDMMVPGHCRLLGMKQHLNQQHDTLPQRDHQYQQDISKGLSRSSGFRHRRAIQNRIKGKGRNSFSSKQSGKNKATIKYSQGMRNNSETKGGGENQDKLRVLEAIMETENYTEYRAKEARQLSDQQLANFTPSSNLTTIHVYKQSDVDGKGSDLGDKETHNDQAISSASLISLKQLQQTVALQAKDLAQTENRREDYESKSAKGEVTIGSLDSRLGEIEKEVTNLRSNTNSLLQKNKRLTRSMNSLRERLRDLLQKMDMMEQNKKNNNQRLIALERIIFKGEIIPDEFMKDQGNSLISQKKNTLGDSDVKHITNHRLFGKNKDVVTGVKFNQHSSIKRIPQLGDDLTTLSTGFIIAKNSVLLASVEESISYFQDHMNHQASDHLPSSLQNPLLISATPASQISFLSPKSEDIVTKTINPNRNVNSSILNKTYILPSQTEKTGLQSSHEHDRGISSSPSRFLINATLTPSLPSHLFLTEAAEFNSSPRPEQVSETIISSPVINVEPTKHVPISGIKPSPTLLDTVSSKKKDVTSHASLDTKSIALQWHELQSSTIDTPYDRSYISSVVIDLLNSATLSLELSNANDLDPSLTSSTTSLHSPYFSKIRSNLASGILLKTDSETSLWITPSQTFFAESFSHYPGILKEPINEAFRQYLSNATTAEASRQRTDKEEELTREMATIKQLLINKTRKIESEMENQRRSLKRYKVIFRKELAKRDTIIGGLNEIATQNSMMVTELAKQVSMIKMEEFISKLQEALENFTKKVITLDQWKTFTDKLVKAANLNKNEILALRQSQNKTSHRIGKLETDTTTVKTSTQRWHRNLQGHVIRLNNTVQDMREQIDRKLDLQQAKALQGMGTPTRSEVQAEIESLHIQLLYNANRLSSVETKMLNTTLESCKQSAQDYKQAAQLLTLQDRYDYVRGEIHLLQEKVKHMEMVVYRTQKEIISKDIIMEGLRSQVKGIAPALSSVEILKEEMDNIIQQVLPDCHAYFQMGYRRDGVYTIHPGTLDKTIRVYCVMEQKESHLSKCAKEAVASRQSNIKASKRESPGSQIKANSKTRSINLVVSASNATSPTKSIQSKTFSKSHTKSNNLQNKESRKSGIFNSHNVENNDKEHTPKNNNVKRKGKPRRGDIVPTESDEMYKNRSSISNRKKRERTRLEKNRKKEITERTGHPDDSSATKSVKKKTTSIKRRKRSRSIHRTTKRAVNEVHKEYIFNKRGSDRSTKSFSTPQATAPATTERSAKGGWTVVQRRQNGKVNFTRPWVQYAAGFGDVDRGDDHWLGNEALHHLTKGEPLELRIIMEDVYASVWEARYSRFRVSGKGDNYRIQVSGYHGNASDGLGQSDRTAFSTMDHRGEEGSKGEHCARFNGGGWWYPECNVSNLNGPFRLGMLWFNNAWRDWVQMKSSVMMVRPTQDSMRWP
ncbi:protein scabrous-like [Plakobranchus ocellatus]|uniref:Protein scabrous-like n=1 Tax=Plakobranchus ocellatus TaxID=259542 RepID=A0AAV3ZEA0_9GAST|nr:protein scabrous-like [Plakobranchus ocellatus]